VSIGSKAARACWVGLVVVVAAYCAARAYFGPTQTVSASAPPVLPGIACLGRFEPEDGVRRLAAPFSMQGPSIIAELLVREGEQVRSNQVLAVTSNYRTFKADYDMEYSRERAIFSAQTF
jgi:multidrug efflux pump subunit AcrA (membrane-fusion protein)